MLMQSKPDAGYTLIELLIGSAIGLVIIGAALGLFLTNLRGQADSTKLTRLNQDLRAMMDIMVRDIRRAGFVTSQPTTNQASLQDNPFFEATTAGATTDIAILGGGDCIVYAYNRDDDNPPLVDSNERLGFRLNGNTLQMRKYGSTNENCSTGAEWETITEPEVEITAISFDMPTPTALNSTSMSTDTNGDGCMDGDSNCNEQCDDGEPCLDCVTGQSCLYIRSVDITLSGRLIDDPNVTQSITERVRIRNDKFVASLP